MEFYRGEHELSVMKGIRLQCITRQRFDDVTFEALRSRWTVFEERFSLGDVTTGNVDDEPQMPLVRSVPGDVAKRYLQFGFHEIDICVEVK